MRKINLAPTSCVPILLLAFFLFSGSAFAQQAVLFSPSPKSLSDLKGKPYDAYQRLLNAGEYANMERIDFAPVTTVVDAQAVNIFVEDIIMQIRTIEYISELDYYLYAVREQGNAQNDPGDAELLLRSDQGKRYGTYRKGDRFFVIEDLGDGIQVLAEQAPSGIAAGTAMQSPIINPAASVPGLPSGGGGSGANAGGGPEKSGENCDVRVAFLYTVGATAIVPSIGIRSNEYIMQANQALENSGIAAPNLRFQMAGFATIGSVNETGLNTVQTILNVRNDATANGLRDAFDADVVCLVVNDNLAAFGTSTGIAFTGANGAPATNANGYCVIISQQSLFANLFPHEVGHVLGAGSEPAANTSTAVNKAHEFTYETGILWWRRLARRQTIMYSTFNPLVGILNYSNPDVDHFSGTPTGTPLRDNASILRANSCTVAGYRNATDNLVVNIDGPDTACPLETACYSAVVSGATGPYTYEWAWSLDQINYTVFGTGPNACLNMVSFSAPDLITIRLIVTVPGELPVASYKDLNLIIPPNGEIICNFKKSGSEDAGWVAENSLQIVPNPANQYTELWLDLVQDGPVAVMVYDLAGKLMLELPVRELMAGSHRFELNLDNLPAGSYLLRINTSSGQMSQRLTVSH